MTTPVVTFKELNLPESMLKELTDLGYESPSPIQAKAIPVLMEGRDILGQAQTGTGKTAAFALPTLANLEPKNKNVQVMVLTPTRELALQVAEAFQRYSRGMKGFHVLPIYGGQPMGAQISSLRRGVSVVVGTPGRVIDHLQRGTLKLDGLKTLVLDEADEMLNMGFLEDVEQILKHLPEKRQIALFSATMPPAIERVAKTYLTSPTHIEIAGAKRRNENIRQSLWVIRNDQKTDGLTRLLEAEDYDAAIIFVRTRLAADELAMKLSARGYRCAALQGDMAQKQREAAVNALKSNQLDILIATDVAARGLDVTRISLVINYDIPYDVEAYVHRIGRTGRAGREGKAVLFATPRERRMQSAIEHHLDVKMERYELPSREAIASRRMTALMREVEEQFAHEDMAEYESIAASLIHDFEEAPTKLVAALLRTQAATRPLLAPDEYVEFKAQPNDRREREAGRGRDRERGPRREIEPVQEGMARFRIDVGRNNGVKPGNIVGAIANEASIDANSIGRVVIQDGYSLVDLPSNLDKAVMNHLGKVRVCGRPIKLREWSDDKPEGRRGNGRREGGARREGGRRDGAGKARRSNADSRPPRRRESK